MEKTIELTSGTIDLLKFIHTGLTQENQSVNDLITFIETLIDAYDRGQMQTEFSIN